MISNQLVYILAILATASCVLYSVDSTFKVSLQESPTELCHCHYVQKIRESGWNRIYVKANAAVTMLDQYRAAGFCEGYATYKEIFYAYSNYVKSLALNGSYNVNIAVKRFQDEQLTWLDRMAAAASPSDLYWQQTRAITEQLRYMYRGFLQRLHEQNRLDMYVGFSQFYYLTNMGDLEDIIPAFQHTAANSTSRRNCNSYVRELDGKLYVTHNTWNQYALMLRFFKFYDFPSQDSRIAADKVMFSSRPGDLQSKDDFFLMSSGLSVTETSLENFAPQNFKLLKPQCVPTWLRVNVANRLARTPSQWVDTFLRFRSGTHNNQWVVTDLEKYSRSNTTEILMIEEAFDISVVLNFTERFYKEGYVASYNVPVDQRIYDKLNYSACTFSYNLDGFTYDNDERAILFRKYHPMITDYASMQILLRTNEEEDKGDGLAPRNDLSTKERFAYGMIDMKVAHQNTLNDGYIHTISSPPYNETTQMPVFSWRDWPNGARMGMPDDWGFDWVQIPISIEA